MEIIRARKLHEAPRPGHFERIGRRPVNHRPRLISTSRSWYRASSGGAGDLDNFPQPIRDAIERIYSDDSSGYTYSETDPRFLGEKLEGDALVEAQRLGRSLYWTADIDRKAVVPEHKRILVQGATGVDPGAGAPVAMRAALFDLDKTGTDYYSGLYLFHFARYTMITLSARFKYYPKFMWNASKIPGIKPTKDYIVRHELATQGFSGIEYGRMQEIGQRCAEILVGEEFNHGFPFIFPDYVAKVDGLNAEGVVTAMFSGSSDYVANPLGRLLGFDFSLGAHTRVQRKGKRRIISGVMQRPLLLYTGKAELAAEYVRRLEIDMKNTSVFTDDLKADRPFYDLGSDDTRFIANPDWHLEEQLRTSGRRYNVIRFDGQKSQADAEIHEAMWRAIHKRRKQILFREAQKLAGRGRVNIFFGRMIRAYGAVTLRPYDKIPDVTPP